MARPFGLPRRGPRNPFVKALWLALAHSAPGAPLVVRAGERCVELIVKMAWGVLALIHAAPAAAAFNPALLRRLYGLEPSGDLGVLIAHRAFLFLAVVAGCLVALFDPAARRAMGLVTAISVLGFLWLYARAGAPAGALRVIAIGDLVALAPLALVLWIAWRASAA
jgi:hypothetical protein